MTTKAPYTITNKKEEKRELTVAATIEKTFIDTFKEKAIKRIGKEIEIKGFRKGMAPEKMIIDTVGALRVFEEQVYSALYEIIPLLVHNEKIDALASPSISITKLSPQDDAAFTATFTLMPTIDLPDYKKIAKAVAKISDVTVTEKEINDYIEYIRKNRAESEHLQKKTSGEIVDDSKKDVLPEFNDAFVKTLGNFSSVDDFKKQLTENMQADKKAKEQNKRRTEIIENIISNAKIDLPDILVTEEQERMMNQYKSDIERIGINFDEYLKEIKKTAEDLKKEWYTDAVKRAKMNLILPKIAQIEKIVPDQARVEHEMKHIVEHHKDVDEAAARVYISHVLTNDKVFEFLENL